MVPGKLCHLYIMLWKILALMILVVKSLHLGRHINCGRTWIKESASNLLTGSKDIRIMLIAINNIGDYIKCMKCWEWEPTYLKSLLYYFHIWIQNKLNVGQHCFVLKHYSDYINDLSEKYQIQLKITNRKALIRQKLCE